MIVFSRFITTILAKNSYESQNLFHIHNKQHLLCTSGKFMQFVLSKQRYDQITKGPVFYETRCIVERRIVKLEHARRNGNIQRQKRKSNMMIMMMMSLRMIQLKSLTYDFLFAGRWASVVRFLLTKMVLFSCFGVSLSSAEAVIRWGRKINHLLTA